MDTEDTIVYLELSVDGALDLKAFLEVQIEEHKLRRGHVVRQLVKELDKLKVPVQMSLDQIRRC